MKVNTKVNEVSSDEDDGIESVNISRLQKRSFVAVDKKNGRIGLRLVRLKKFGRIKSK